MSREEESLMSTIDLAEALQAKRAPRRSAMNRRHSSTGNLILGIASETSTTTASSSTPGKNAEWNCAPRRPPLSSQRPQVGRGRSSSNLLTGRSRSSRDLHQHKLSKKKKVNLTAMLDDLKKNPNSLLDNHDHNNNNDQDNHSLSSHSFASKQSGFHPHDGITPDKLGQLSELDLSAMEQQSQSAITPPEHDETPLSAKSFHGFLQNKRKSQSRQRSRSFDAYSNNTSLIPWSPETPLKTFAKNLRYLGRQTTFGRNLTYLTFSDNPQTTFGQNLATLAEWILGSPEESQQPPPTKTHRHFPQEHELATYLQNVSDQSRNLAAAATEPATRKSLWWFS